MNSTITIFLLVIGISGLIASDYTWDSDKTLKSVGKEIDYFLEKNEIYGSVISNDYHNAYFMKVGQNWEEVVGSEHHRVECERLLGENVYRDEYKPQTYFYGSNPNFAYTFIKREVWDCSSVSDSKITQPINFYRIVNLVHGVRPINKVFYFDGIEVMKDICSDQARENYEDINTATLKEIKYINPSDNKILRYDGELTLKDDNVGKDQLEIFVPVDVIVEVQFKGNDNPIESIGNIEHVEKQKLKTQSIGPVGEILRVGNERFTTIGNSEDEAICELQLSEDPDDILLLLTDVYLPKCYLGKKNKEGNSCTFGNKYGSGLVENVNRECFSVSKQEVWKCTYKTLVEDVKDSKERKLVEKKFKRRVTELVGAIPIAEIQYYGAVSVWKYRLDKNSFSVKIREIYYHPDINFHDQIRFNGVVKLKKPSVIKTQQQQQQEAYLFTYNSTAPSVRPELKPESSMMPMQSLRGRLDPKSANPGYFGGEPENDETQPSGGGSVVQGEKQDDNSGRFLGKPENYVPQPSGGSVVQGGKQDGNFGYFLGKPENCAPQPSGGSVVQGGKQDPNSGYFVGSPGNRDYQPEPM